MENKANLHIKEVELSGYKSINSVKTTFKNGLNIIIGKNAAGKTNFLSFLKKNLDFSFDDFLNFSSKLILENNRIIELGFSRTINIDELSMNILDTNLIECSLKIDNKSIIVNDVGLIETELPHEDIIFNSTFIKHGIPKGYLFVETPLNFSISEKGNSPFILKVIRTPNSPHYIKSILTELLFDTPELRNQNDKPENIDISINNVFNIDNRIKSALKKITPIEDVRINRNYNLFSDEEIKGYSVNNLFLEFLIGESWHPFSNLSDGTKRLFYIISEVSSSSNYYFTKNTIGRNSKQESRLILIEEPELGIHPHQLKELMQFLKEEAETKQIIITTHSPQVLDILERNELDRIIIASAKDRRAGTQLRHLSANEILKVQNYMDENYLSDYWQYSNLEKE